MRLTRLLPVANSQLDQLLGDDFTDRLKTVKESKKAAQQLTGHKRKRNEEYSRSTYPSRGNFIFSRRVA